MKKPNKKLIIRLKNLNNKERRNSKSYSYNVSKSKRNIENIKFSNNLSLFIPKERQKIVKLVQAVESKTTNKYFLNFSDVEVLNPLTALYITHSLDKYPDAKFHSKFCKAVIPRAVFKLLGINQSFSLGDINKSKYHTYVDDWNIFSGEDGDLPKSTTDHLIEMRNLFEDKNAFFKLFNAIMEAINNVVQHAYHESSYKKWFMLTHLCENKDTNNKSISVVVSDLGVSVPYNTPKSFSEKISDMVNYDINKFLRNIGFSSEKTIESTEELRSFNDTRLIKIATSLHSTSTNVEGRGKGFNDILDLVRSANKFKEIGSVTTSVLSRSGSYVYKAFPDGTSKEVSLNDGLEDFDNQIRGTVISWTIQFI